MTNFSFNQTIEVAKKEYGLGSGEYFKIQENDNRIRVLSQALPHESEYQGKKSVKFVAWVIDRKDGVIKPYFMPLKIVRALAALQDDPEWTFDSVPMPYDINIKAKNAGELNVEYTVIGSPNKTPLTAEEEKALAERDSIETFVQKLAEKEGKKQASQPQSEVTTEDEAIDVSDIPY